MDFIKMGQRNLKKREKNRVNRIREQANPSVQESIYYVSQFEDGLMHVQQSTFSSMYKLGELDYDVASEDDQLTTVLNYSEALNSLDQRSTYQLLVVNRPTDSNMLEKTLLDYQADKTDHYRQEVNEIITRHYQHDQKNFTVDKYAVFSTDEPSRKQADHSLDTRSKNFKNRLDANDTELTMEKMDGIQRLKVLASLLNPAGYFHMSYKDMSLSGWGTKSFITPSQFVFPNNQSYFRLGERYGAVLYIRQYPRYLEDKLMKELCALGIPLAISLHAKPYDMIQVRKKIQTQKTLNDTVIRKEQRENFKRGISDTLISGEASEINTSANALMEEIKENGQKIFSGLFTVFVSADSITELEESIQSVKGVGQTWQVVFDVVRDYKEEALNTILPLGKPYLDGEMDYMRDMTTANIASQVPFTNIELQSPTGQFYGKNQMTNNMILIDRKKDQLTPSGLIFGTSGSGKGMATKWEIINALLKYPNDRFVIVDPESEYLPIAREFGAEILDIATGTTHHFNLLDMVDQSLLDEEDQTVDLVKEKANLLSGLFASLLQQFSDMEAAMVDRVTRKVYERFKDRERVPTLVDWHHILCEQEDRYAKDLAVKVEPYTIGSQDIFAHETTIDLGARFVVFNIKKLDERMKPFAMKVILDQIWQQVVFSQGKTTTRLYFDELQLNFDSEANASWFMALWSRIRKYGACPTGITQNVSTLLDTHAGKRIISNSEFLLLLRQKPVDLQRLTEVIHLTPKLRKYIGERIPQGTGLIASNGLVVPFENPIPSNTKLFELMNTDA